MSKFANHLATRLNDPIKGIEMQGNALLGKFDLLCSCEWKKNIKVEKVYVAQISCFKITGSDEELSLVKALERAFPKAPLVFCTLHIRKNINRFLQDHGTSKQTRKEIDKAIFDEKDGLASSKKTHFERKATEFRAKYGKHFTQRYIDALMKRIQANVNHPALVAKSVR